MDENTMMRVPKELLKEIKKCKEYRRETYADVVKRLVDNQKKMLKKVGY